MKKNEHIHRIIRLIIFLIYLIGRSTSNIAISSAGTLLLYSYIVYTRNNYWWCFVSESIIALTFFIWLLFKEIPFRDTLFTLCIVEIIAYTILIIIMGAHDQPLFGDVESEDHYDELF